MAHRVVRILMDEGGVWVVPFLPFLPRHYRGGVRCSCRRSVLSLSLNEWIGIGLPSAFVVPFGDTHLRLTAKTLGKRYVLLCMLSPSLCG